MSKLLAYMETPFIETGSGQVSKNLLPVLHEFFDHIHVVAINQFQPPALLPDWLTLTCTSGEDHAATKESREAINAGGYDAIFMSTDLNRIAAFDEELSKVDVPIVMYALMDTHVWQSQFWQVMDRATVPVLPSDWACRQALALRPHLKDKLLSIYHGCEPEEFYPLTVEDRRKARKEFFGITDDEKFLVLNVNRNQVRKDIPRTMAAFHLFHLEHPESMLYLHSRRVDLGGDLASQALYMGIDIYKNPAEVVFAPETYFAASGVPRAELNRLYNCADVFVTTTTGEGWGLTTTEAMAAGVPIIGPDNTTFPEILGKIPNCKYDQFQTGERGLLVKSGGPDLWVTFFTVSDVPRELVSTTATVAALEEVYNNREAARERAQAGREWTKEHTWLQIQDQWREVWQSIGLSSRTSELLSAQHVTVS